MALGGNPRSCHTSGASCFKLDQHNHPMPEGSTPLDPFKAFEAEGWGKRAGTYGAQLGAMSARVAEPLLDAAGVRHDMRMLDIATGPGYAAERAAIRGAH